jgi:hypothetical protein
MYVDSNAQVTFDGCTISHVDAGTGGVLFIQSAAAAASTIAGTTFSDNMGNADIWLPVDHDRCAKFVNANPPNTFDLTPCDE